MDTIWTTIRLMTMAIRLMLHGIGRPQRSLLLGANCQGPSKLLQIIPMCQCVCFPNGLSICLRKFIKLLKPVFATLRHHGHMSSRYIDDPFPTEPTYDECALNVIATITPFDSLGFLKHPDKSALIPSQVVTFLGFVLNSATMRVYLTGEKAVKIKQECLYLTRSKAPTIWEVARIIGGLITFSFPGVAYGPLYYRHLEWDKGISSYAPHFQSAKKFGTWTLFLSTWLRHTLLSF